MAQLSRRMKMLKKMFGVEVKVASPIVVGQDDIVGRRQLIPIVSGKLEGVDYQGKEISGEVLPGGVDSQIIRPDGICELSARYAIRLDDGRSFYLENNGVRSVPKEDVAKVVAGEFVESSHYYFATSPQFEIYDSSLDWLKKYFFVCQAKRYVDRVVLDFYLVE